MPNKIYPWWLAIRPKTLAAAIAPVMMGTVMAFRDGEEHLPSAVLALAGALLIQMGTNLANDYYDFIKGTDQQDRIGPLRVTQAGLIAPFKVKMAFILCYFLAAVCSLYLIWRGGWPILGIGVASIFFGILYTAGPCPFGHLGLGEIFVLIFFGPVAVAGTYYVQSLEINPAVVIAGLGPGLISAAILAVNNLRDLETDRRANKKTLAVRFGRSFAVAEYLLFLQLAAMVPTMVYLITDDYPYSLAAVTISLWAIPASMTVLTKTDGPSLNNALALTGKLLLVYTLLFSMGWLL